MNRATKGGQFQIEDQPLRRPVSAWWGCPESFNLCFPSCNLFFGMQWCSGMACSGPCNRRVAGSNLFQAAALQTWTSSSTTVVCEESNRKSLHFVQKFVPMSIVLIALLKLYYVLNCSCYCWPGVTKVRP